MDETQMRQIMATTVAVTTAELSDEEMKYRIRWAAKLTGASGFGTGTFSKSEAENEVNTLNGKKDNFCIHEIVLVDKADEEKE